MCWRQCATHTLLLIRSRSWTRGVCALLWTTQMAETCIPRLQTRRRLAKCVIRKTKFWIGSFKWLWLLSTYTTGRFYIETWRLKIFSWLKLAQLRSVILELPESCSILTTVLKLPLALLTTSLPKSVRKSPYNLQCVPADKTGGTQDRYPF